MSLVARAVLNPTLWAVGLATTIVAMTRPRPAARRPGNDDVALDASSYHADTVTDVQAAEHRAEASCGRPIDSSGELTAERSLRHWLGSRRGRGVDDATALARWCDALARAVRGGDTLQLALRGVAAPERHRRRVDRLVRELERSGAWTVARHTDSTADLDLVLAVVGACHEHGGPAAEPLDRAAEVLRGRAAERAERRVHSAQARLSAQVMSILPLAMLVVLTVASSAVRDVMARPVGIALVVSGLGLELIGWMWMRRVIARSAR